MPCNRPNVTDYLSNFTGSDPVDAIICPYTQASGADMGQALFFMFFISFMGLGLTVRVQHPAPILVSAMLSAGLFATLIPGIIAKIGAIALFFGISALGIYIYNRAKSEL